MKAWITGIFAASLLSSAAMALCPRGRARQVLRMVCGIICALAIAEPLLTIDPDILSAEMAEHARQGRRIAEETEEEGKRMERAYIEEECAAYILGKAAEEGAAVEEVSVLARWDDETLLWFPWSAAIRGPYSEALARRIEADLGIPEERQEWSADG